MKMKKITAIFLAGSLTVSMGTMASASGPTPANNKAEIKATYSEETLTPTVYHIDVEWGNLEYTYNSGKTQTWNPQTLLFEEAIGKPSWNNDDVEAIKVVNHSNTGITATFSYEEKNSSGVKGSFSQQRIGLIAPAENSELSAAPSGSTKLMLDGSIPDTINEKSVVGGVTVTITDGAFVCMTEGSPAIPMYATDEPGVYKVTYSTTEDTYENIVIRFTINGKKYVMMFDGEIKEDTGIVRTYTTYPGINYEFLFDMNNMTYKVIESM